MSLLTEGHGVPGGQAFCLLGTSPWPSACRPMLLGIPGDNTYANYAEANRAFYRHDRVAAGGAHAARVLRLAGVRLSVRTCGIWYDADQVDGLSMPSATRYGRGSAPPTS